MNYETRVTAEKGDPIAVGFDPDAEEYESKRRSDRRKVLIIAGLLVLGLAIAAFFVMRSNGTATPAGDENAQAPTVTVITPGRTTVEGQITATGTLSARREMPVGVVGEGGRVVSVPVDAGDWVRQGQRMVPGSACRRSSRSRAPARRFRSPRPMPIWRRPISIARCSWSSAALSPLPMSIA